MKKELTFETAGDTKNCYKYLEIDTETGKQLDPRDGIIGMLYVKKKTFDEGGASVPPNQVKVFLEW